MACFVAVCALSCVLPWICLGCSDETAPKERAAVVPVKKSAADKSRAIIRTTAPETPDVETSNPSLTPAPAPPNRPSALSVIDFYPASHAGPDDTSEWPRPVTVVLHGNFDRPEWECATWKEAAGFYGWVLCPRGVRTPHATLKEDRWTYGGPASVQREIDASLKSLIALYPGQVSAKNTVLAGFSLGAIYAPRLAVDNPGRYPYVFLVEGGVEKLDAKVLEALKRSGVKAIGMAMSAPGRRARAMNLLSAILKQGLKAAFVDMKGAGHGYRSDFAVNGRAALKKLVYSDFEDDAGTKGR